MNQKIKDFMIVFVVQLLFSMPFFTAQVYGLTISDVKVAKVTESSATVEWKTDVPATGVVHYGIGNTNQTRDKPTPSTTNSEGFIPQTSVAA